MRLAAGRHALLLAVIVVYFALGVVYSVATPSFEAPDEFYHYAYVQYLAEGRGLPVVDPTLRSHQIRQEVAQPPLYYALAAPIAMLVPDKHDLSMNPRNPHARIGNPLFDAQNGNVFVHSSEEVFPWKGDILASHLIRFFSLFLSCGVIVAAYLVALRFRPHDRACATLAAALVAFNPQFLFISASVNNDVLINLLGGVSLAFLLWGLDGRFGWRYPALLGALTALAVLAKPSGLALVALVGLALLWMASRHRSWRRLIGEGAVYLLPVIVLTGWWFVRNYQLYADPLALVVHSSFGMRQTPIGLLDMLIGEAEGLWLSYWGVFGMFDILAPSWLYWVFDVVSVMAGLGLIVGLVRAVRRNGVGHWFHVKGDTVPIGIVLVLTFLWIGFIGAALAKWSLVLLASQGRLMFPALAAVAALMALGLWQFPVPKRVLGGALTSVMVGVAFVVPVMAIMPTYAQPPLQNAALMSSDVPNPMRASFDGKMELMGYRLDRAVVKAGGRANLTLYWRVLEKMDKDYSLWIHVYDDGNQAIGQVDTFPLNGAYRTSEFVPGQAYVETYTLPISSKARAPGMGRVDVGLYELATKEILPSYDAQMRPMSTVLTGTFRIVAPSDPNVRPLKVVGKQFGGQIELLGYDLQSEEWSAGSVVAGKLYWRGLTSPEKDYTEFIHLVGPKGMVAQYDAQPRQGQYPTTVWERGDVVDDTFQIAIPAGVPNGEYQLRVGLYDLSTGKRLSVGGDDSVFLGTVRLH